MDRWMGRDSLAGRGFLHRWVPKFNSSGRFETVHDEPFLDAFNASSGSYTAINIGGFTATANPVISERGENGAVETTFAFGSAAAGSVRHRVNSIDVDGFGGGSEWAWAVRIKALGDAPVVTDRDYIVLTGLFTQETGVADPLDGVGWYHDKDTSFWTCAARRNGTETPQASTLAWDNDYHVLGLHISGDASTMTPFVDGSPLTPITGANIQPGDELQSVAVQNVLVGAMTEDAVFRVSHVAYGYTL